MAQASREQAISISISKLYMIVFGTIFSCIGTGIIMLSAWALVVLIALHTNDPIQDRRIADLETDLKEDTIDRITKKETVALFEYADREQSHVDANQDKQIKRLFTKRNSNGVPES